jgi:subtilisin family serine protease
MPGYKYYCGGKTFQIQLDSMDKMMRRAAGPRRGPATAPSAPQLGRAVAKSLRSQRGRLATRFGVIQETAVKMSSRSKDGTYLVATESLVLDKARSSEIKFAAEKYGFEQVQEGRHGKVLLQAPGDDTDRVALVFRVATAIHRRGKSNAHPNFLRAAREIRVPGRAGSTAALPWNLDNPGNPGVPGADVHAVAAWTRTQSDVGIRVAVLDEGVDTLHPYLKGAVVAEADFVDENDHARPDGNDAHGTACAGIIASQSDHTPGLAWGCSLVAARIAKDDGFGFWIFDDFDTADAIDWSWDDAKADVLSNSWGGGPPVDVITNAFERARTQGRNGRGAVVAIAAGNEQAPVSFPATLPNVITVGASNEWDKRKTRASQDGESWWGSNSGPSLDLLAPGVHIRTTDIRGSRGYAGGLYTHDFNGTSSATPHVAAAAALVLSVNPGLAESRVRAILNETADPLSAGGWNSTEGHGRLNAYRAVWQAQRG